MTAGPVGLGGDAAATLDERWASDTGTGIGANHNAVAAGAVDGEGVAFAPVSGSAGSEECRLAALDGATGGTE